MPQVERFAPELVTLPASFTFVTLSAMPVVASPPSSSANALSVGRIVVETLTITLLFFLFAGGEVPGVNESHYLCKAKHYWNPDWCRDDLFLNSADAHAVFYWTFGWLTLFFSLPATAWIGRVAVWLLQAWAWQQLNWSIVPKRWYSLLSAGAFLAFLQHGHMAGEWVVGDVEAKGVAYAFVFLGLAAIVQQRWRWVFPLLGIGAAFHVIVGGWAVIAAGFAWFVCRYLFKTGEQAPSPAAMFPFVFLGLAFSLPGLLPCLLLDQRTSSETIAEGNIAYVYARLSHHTVIHRLPAWYLARHALLVLIALVLAYATRHSPSVRRLSLFTVGALLIAIAGIAIDQSLLSAPPAWSARLLRYYWYRLSDATVPIFLALCLTWLCAAGDHRSSRKARTFSLGQIALLSGLMLLAIANLVGMRINRLTLGVPVAEISLQSRREKPLLSLRQRHHDWQTCCKWISEHTKTDATFLTPRGQQTFKWYAQRCEVVSWKDAPQDAKSLVAWLRRYEDVHPRPADDPLMFGAEVPLDLPWNERIALLGQKYSAQFVVVDREQDLPTRDLVPVYPRGDEFNASFAVYRLPTSR